MDLGWTQSLQFEKILFLYVYVWVLGTIEEQYVLFTTEPFQQPEFIVFESFPEDFSMQPV